MIHPSTFPSGPRPGHCSDSLYASGDAAGCAQSRTRSPGASWHHDICAIPMRPIRHDRVIVCWKREIWWPDITNSTEWHCHVTETTLRRGTWAGAPPWPSGWWHHAASAATTGACDTAPPGHAARQPSRHGIMIQNVRCGGLTSSNPQNGSVM